MTSIHMTKDELVAALTAQKERAEKQDAKALAKHQRDEERWLKQTQKVFAKLSKASYEEVKGSLGRSLRLNCLEPIPSCPIAEVNRYTAALRALEYDRRSNFIISQDGKNRELHRLLMAGTDHKVMC